MLGICCQWLEPKAGKIDVYENVTGERSLLLGRFTKGEYSPEFIREIWLSNIRSLDKLYRLAHGSGLRMLRLSSGIFPLFDKIAKSPEYTGMIEDCLNKLGELKLDDMRLTCHPGQFVVLSSDSDSVVENSVRDLDYHATIMDALGQPRNHRTVINIHGGKRGRSERLIANILSLPEKVRSRLTLENDELCYSVKDLFRVWQATGTPIVLDSHHWSFNTGDQTLEEAMDMASSTWPDGIRPVQHISNSEPGTESGSFTERRQHSFRIWKVPEPQQHANNSGLADIEVECKGKNLGFLPYLSEIGLSLV